MKTLATVSMSAIAAICIFAAPTPARAADTSQSATQLSVPAQLKSAMDAAFKAGRDYFIWTTNTTVKGSVAPMMGSTLHLYVHVMAKFGEKAPQFRIHMDLQATNTETNKITKFSTTFPGKPEKANAYEAGRPYDVFFFVHETSLKGVGTAKVYLIAADGTTEDSAPISNMMELKVEF